MELCPGARTVSSLKGCAHENKIERTLVKLTGGMHMGVLPVLGLASTATDAMMTHARVHHMRHRSNRDAIALYHAMHETYATFTNVHSL